jgi:hypothetical protein
VASRAHITRSRGGSRGESRHVGCNGSVALGRPARNNTVFLFFQNYSNEFQLIWSEDRLPVLENFQVKYRFEGFEERNNFLHRNFFRFKLYFE